METLETFLQKNAYYGHSDKLTTVDVKSFLANYTLAELNTGMNTRVYKVKGEPWVVKEGRWDIDFNLIGNIKVMLPAQALEDFLSFFEFHFLPRPEEILKQYNFYLKFAEYFGYFDDDSFFHPTLVDIMAKQEEIRTHLSDKIELVEDFFKCKFHTKLSELLSSDDAFTNFLPKEYLLYGPPLSEKSGDKDTYYIFQEYVDGKLLHDVKDVSVGLKRKLIVLTFLMLLLRVQKNLVPDTRPRYVLTEGYDWLTKTDNIIVSADKVKFIDTRWMWDTQNNVVKRGIMIPELTMTLAKRYINYELENI